MQFPFPFFESFTLPFDAGPLDERIEFDGVNGEIRFYGLNATVPQMTLSSPGGGSDPITWSTDDPDVTDDAGIGALIGLGADPTTRYRISWTGVEQDDGRTPRISLYSESEDHTTSPPAIEFTTLDGGSGLIRGPRLAVPTTGADRPIGRAVLVAGTVTVANQLVTANTNILLTRQIPGGTVGDLSCATRVANTSFDILSTSALDTSTVAWMLWEPTA